MLSLLWYAAALFWAFLAVGEMFLGGEKALDYITLMLLGLVVAKLEDGA